MRDDITRMAQTSYRDLAEFGLPLVTPDDPAFPALAREIESRREPFDPRPTGDLDQAAVLLNQSGKAIVGFSYVWRYTTAQGVTRPGRFANLCSSDQLEVLTGRTKVAQDLGSFILPGSKRLITQQGMFGNNLDVLPPDEGRRYPGCIGYGGGGGRRNRMGGEPIAATELCLDFVVLEDGLCAGPDESELFDSLTESLEIQRNVAQEVVTALNNGASAGQVFEILRPIARFTPPPPPSSRRPHGTCFVDLFAGMAIQRLINASGSDLLAWFEGFAQPPSLRLHRPS